MVGHGPIAHALSAIAELAELNNHIEKLGCSSNISAFLRQNITEWVNQ